MCHTRVLAVLYGRLELACKEHIVAGRNTLFLCPVHTQSYYGATNTMTPLEGGYMELFNLLIALASLIVATISGIFIPIYLHRNTGRGSKTRESHGKKVGKLAGKRLE